MMLPEFDMEIANTRKTLERVPFDKINWKAHPKSGTMGWYAGHLAGLPGWCKETFTRDELDIAPDGKPPAPDPIPATKEELLERFDKNVAAGRAALGAASDEYWMGNWSLLAGGKKLFTMP